jgi:hypothetical protein
VSVSIVHQRDTHSGHMEQDADNTYSELGSSNLHMSACDTLSGHIQQDADATYSEQGASSLHESDCDTHSGHMEQNVDKRLSMNRHVPDKNAHSPGKRVGADAVECEDFGGKIACKKRRLDFAWSDESGGNGAGQI